MTIPLADVGTHRDVQIEDVPDAERFSPSADLGASRYQARLANGSTLNAFLINKRSDVLVVAFHGATQRRQKLLPRFEWMRTLRDTEFSSLYFSDPCLELDEKLELAWYTGWKDLDLYPMIANWISRAADIVGASRVILLGSSGGGLASLQISALIDGSMALPFNCQTSISGYLVGRVKYTAQYDYLRGVMPHLRPEGRLEDQEPGSDWASPLGDRLSAIKRYQVPRSNFVYYAQNNNDITHQEQHYQPFRNAIETSPNSTRISFVNYDGPRGHKPPTIDVFHEHLSAAVKWLREL